ncbi:MAG: zf-HC2 domain-containing protein [bacterium]|nr:zf-HC2 domain-containing protein [bacterium]
MECDQVKPLLDEFVEGELSSPEKETVEKHLEDCPSCREEVSALRRTMRLIAEFGEVNEPSDFLQRVRQRIEAPARRSLLARLTERPLIARALATVGCLMLVALGALLVYRQLSPNLPPSVAERKPRPSQKPEVIALVRSKSEEPLHETVNEPDVAEGEKEGEILSRTAFGKADSRARETATPSAPHEQDWGEVRGKANLDVVSGYSYTNGRAYDAMVALNEKAGRVALAPEESPAEQKQLLFTGEEVALKKKNVEVGALLSLDPNADQKDQLATQGGPASERLSSAGSLVRQELEPTPHAEGYIAGQPAPATPGAPLPETQETVPPLSVESPPSPEARAKFLYRDMPKGGESPPEAPAISSEVRTAGDEYRLALPQEERALPETMNQAGTGVTAGEYVQPNRPELGRHFEGLPDETGGAHLGLRYAPAVDDDDDVSDLTGLLERQDEGASGDTVPEFLLTVQNRRKALEEISRFVVDLGGETKSISPQQVLARGVALQKDEGLVIILPRAGYEKFQDKFPIRPASRGGVLVEYEHGMSGQVERRRARGQETVTFVLRVIESSPRPPSQQAVP